VAKTRKIELRYPLAGVGRRVGLWDGANARPPYPAPWAMNVRAEDPLASRLRGGSRPGLTKYLNTDLGTVVGLLPLATASATGASSVIALVADGALGVIESAAVTYPTGRLLTEGGDGLLTEGSDNILASTGSVPSSCFLVSRGQKVYAIATTAITVMDVSSGVIDTLEATSGTVPSDCTFGAVYRDRLFLAGDDNAIYCCRQGNFADWNFGADLEDAGRATIFQLADAAVIGGVATALVPHHDAYLLAASVDTLWVIRGDPTAGGKLRNVSPDVGIKGARAWCKVGDQVVFLSNDGLYEVRANGEGLKLLSDERIPEELVGIAATTTINLAYHHDKKVVHIFLTPASGTGTHWIFDLQTGGFWPDQYQSDHEPAAVCRFGDDLLIAGDDGYLRYIGGDDDDGTDIQSHVLLGPLRLAPTTETSVLTEVEGSLAIGSGSVTWRIVPGNSAEEAVEDAKTAVGLYLAGNVASAEAYAVATGTFTAGRNRRTHPRIRSPWYCVWLQSTAKWAWEWMALRGIEAGRYR